MMRIVGIGEMVVSEGRGEQDGLLRKWEVRGLASRVEEHL
jgi:hypothetical protein